MHLRLFIGATIPSGRIEMRMQKDRRWKKALIALVLGLLISMVARASCQKGNESLRPQDCTTNPDGSVTVLSPFGYGEIKYGKYRRVPLLRQPPWHSAFDNDVCEYFGLSAMIAAKTKTLTAAEQAKLGAVRAERIDPDGTGSYSLIALVVPSGYVDNSDIYVDITCRDPKF